MCLVWSMDSPLIVVLNRSGLSWRPQCWEQCWRHTMWGLLTACFHADCPALLSVLLLLSLLLLSCCHCRRLNWTADISWGCNLTDSVGPPEGPLNPHTICIPTDALPPVVFAQVTCNSRVTSALILLGTRNTAPTLRGCLMLWLVWLVTCATWDDLDVC